MKNKPDFTKPVDIEAFFYNELGLCGCSEEKCMVRMIRDLLKWIDEPYCPYDELFNGNVGVYYVIVGILDSSDICTHGTSIRRPFLTDLGKKFLLALENIDMVDVFDHNDVRVGYDGVDYANFVMGV